jgi:hypothetical protein
MRPSNGTSDAHEQAGFESFKWMRGVSRDHVIMGLRRLILISLCLYRNGKTGLCDPAYDTIANDVGVDRATVIRAIADGVRRGWLVQPVRRGPTSNSFAFTFPVNLKPQKDVAPEQHQAANEVAPVRHHSEKDVAPVHKRSRTRAQMMLHPCDPNGSLNGRRERGKSQTQPPEPFVEGKKNASGKARQKKNIAGDGGADRFAEFWAVYPRRVGKLDAEKAFAKAIEQADAETIIVGAKRYASERVGQDSKYTKHPATWLNKGCWSDEPTRTDGPPIIDNLTGDIIEVPSPRRRRYDDDAHMTPQELAASILAELEAQDGH